MMALKRVVRILLLTFVGIIATQSCSHHPYIVLKHKHKKSAPELKLMISDINRFTKGKFGDTDIRIGFVDDYKVKGDDGHPMTIIGSCHAVRFITPEIDINRKAWRYMPYTERFLLVAHELGHCECKVIGHVDGKLPDGCPTHYMNAISASNYCLGKHASIYLEQVKLGCDY